MKAFQQARLKDEWVDLFLDGVGLHVRADASRQLLAFLGSRRESQTVWKGLLSTCIGAGWKAEI